MKTVEEILRQQPVFLDRFEEKQDIANDFEVILPENLNILFAYYNYEDYSGDAYVLFEQDNELYEVFGSHCSCYGLEGQWEPEAVVYEEIKNRYTKGESYRGYINPLKVFLGLQQ